ncbi:MAG: hypothetical protein ACF8GE_11810 [Phycisphaerales bacterium JB043]
MIRTVATILVSSVFAHSAHAGFFGLVMRWQTTATLSTGEDVHVFSLHARFFEPVQLLNVFEANWVADIPFYQTGAPFGGDVVSNSGFFGFDSDLQWDTWVTLGDPDAADGTDTTVDPDFAMGPNTISGGWFDANPGTPDGQTDASNEALVAQLSFYAEDYGVGPGAPISGSLGVTWKDGTGATVQDVWSPLFGGFLFEGPPPPAPGSTIALLAGLGLASRRRRG